MAMPPATECRCGTLSAAAAPEQAGTHWLQAHRVPSQQKIRPGSSFDDLISTGEDCRRDRQAERVSRFEVDHQIKSLFLPASASYTSRSSGASRAPGFLHCFVQGRRRPSLPARRDQTRQPESARRSARGVLSCSPCRKLHRSDRLVEILVHGRHHPAPLVFELVRYSRGRCRPRRYRGGGSGRCVRSKQSDMAFELPSRSFNAGKLKVFWQKRTRLTCEFSSCEMCPAFA